MPLTQPLGYPPGCGGLHGPLAKCQCPRRQLELATGSEDAESAAAAGRGPGGLLMTAHTHTHTHTDTVSGTASGGHTVAGAEPKGPAQWHLH